MEPLQNDRAWTARWIGAGFLHNESGAPSRPAPFFRRPFFLSGRGKKAEVFFCGLGWSELYLNGEKVGDAVLSPSVTQYDRRARYLRYDVTKLLRRGENVFGALLGNGWYDCSTGEVWHFDKAPWQDYPKLLFELVIDGRSVLVSDDSWRCLRSDGPIRFNELRNGESYDARKEIPGWAAPGFRESAQWTSARVVPGPGGVMTEQTMPPCRVMKRLRRMLSLCFRGADLRPRAEYHRLGADPGQRRSRRQNHACLCGKNQRLQRSDSSGEDCFLCQDRSLSDGFLHPLRKRNRGVGTAFHLSRIPLCGSPCRRRCGTPGTAGMPGAHRFRGADRV